jgi:hypothetical protein
MKYKLKIRQQIYGIPDAVLKLLGRNSNQPESLCEVTKKI